MTARELYDTDPQAATDLWTDGYRAGERRLHDRRQRDLPVTGFWLGFWTGILVSIAALVMRITLL